MKLQTASFYCLFFVLSLFLINCGNNSSRSISYIRKIAHRKYNKQDKYNWNYERFAYVNNKESCSFIFFRNNLTFGNYNTGIDFFDGHKIINVLEKPDTNLVSMDFNSRFIAYTVHPVWINYQLKHILFISKIINNKVGVKLAETHKFIIPFSQRITGIKFINKNHILITSFLEYGIVSIITKKNGDFYIKFKHYPFLPYNLEVRLQIATTYKVGNFIIYGGKGASLFKTIGVNKYLLKKLFYYKEENKQLKADDYQILKIALVDTSFGAFLTNYSLVYYRNNNKKGNQVFTKKNYIKLFNNDSVSAENIADVKVLDDSEFVCLTRNGLLLKKTIYKDDLTKSKWKIISKIPATIIYNIEVLNKDSVYVTDANGLYLVKRRLKKGITRPSLNVKNGLYFDVERLAQQSTSYGVGIANLNDNNTNDIYIVDVYDRNKLFTSVPGLTINKIPDNLALQRGIGGRTSSSTTGEVTYDLDIGVAIGDINEDGADDVLLSNLAYSNSLYLNNKKGYFQDATNEFKFNVNMWRSEGIVLGDVNNDGYLDVFCTSYFKSNKLFINKYGISLDDMTSDYNLNSDGRSISAVFGDVNNDGYLDLYVGNWIKSNKLYFNNGKGEFIDHTKKSNLELSDLKETNSVFFADLNNDGYLDLFVGNRAGGDKLYINNGNGSFKDETIESGLNGNYHTYGAVFADFDNDGWQDLALACLGGIKIFKNLGTDKYGNIHFKDITNDAIRPGSIFKSYNTGLATADFGNKGFMDLVMNQNGGYTYFILNKELLNGYNNYLSVKVEGDESNRDAIGAKLKLFYKDSLIGYREVSGGFGYASSSSKIQHFGLGSIKDSLYLSIDFPASGIHKSIAVKPNTFIKISEHTGLKRSYFLTKKTLLRFFYGEGFLILGLEIILLSMIFTSLILFTAQKLNLQQLSKKKLYFNWKLLTFSLILFYIVKLISVESMSFYFGPAYFIINSENIITDEILPLLISSIFIIAFLLVKRNRENRDFAGYNVLDNLLNILKRFGHGEGMLIILHRLSLLIENVNINKENQSDYDKEALERISSACNEYRSAVLPEIEKIYNLLKQLEIKSIEKSQKIQYSNYAKSILQDSEQISYNCEIILNGLNSNEKIKSKYDAVSFIKNLREELKGLRHFIQLNFSTNITESIETAIKKFDEQYQRYIIEYRHDNKNVNAIISPSDFNEVVNILIQNAVEEFKDKKITNGLIKINVECIDEYVFIKIEDNGKGIPKENMEKLFVEGFTTKSYGHGIGLNIIKKCLEKYEGEISVSSGELNGALFTLKLKAT